MKPGVKSRMKMLQLHLSDRQFYCLLRCSYIRDLTVPFQHWTQWKLPVAYQDHWPLWELAFQDHWPQWELAYQDHWPQWELAYKDHWPQWKLLSWRNFTISPRRWKSTTLVVYTNSPVGLFVQYTGGRLTIWRRLQERSYNHKQRNSGNKESVSIQ